MNEPIIRLAVENDIPKLLEMGRQFFNISKYNTITDLDEVSLIALFMGLMEDPNGLLFVAEQDNKLVGMLGALIYPLYLNRNHLSAQELFWWAEQGSGTGKALYQALEEALKNRGVKSVTMIALDSVNPDKMDRIYKNLGYKLSEHAYIKVL